MARLNVVGMDPSSRNWGIAAGNIITETNVLTVAQLACTRQVEAKGKQVRQSSQDLAVAKLLAEGALPYKGANVAFAEIPQGSQNSRASLCSGICIGILGAFRALGWQFIEVSPTEVKMASVGKKTATKAEMIEWAMATFPNAPWPMHNGKINAGLAEHMADACAAIVAGIRTDQYLQLVAMLR